MNRYARFLSALLVLTMLVALFPVFALAQEPGAEVVEEQTTQITLQPQDVTIAPGGTAVFTVVAQGVNLKYQWQSDFGDGDEYFIDLDVSDSSSAKRASLSIKPPYSGCRYRVLVTGTYGEPVLSSSATAEYGTVVSLEITQNPSDRRVLEGETASFTVAALPANNTDVQWERKLAGEPTFTPISSGGTGNTYTVADVTPALHGSEYRAKVSSGNASLYSSSALLRVVVATKITAQPLPQAVNAEGNAIFYVTAVGETLEYQWQCDYGLGDTAFTDIPAAREAGYAVTGVHLLWQGYRYRVRVSGENGQVCSEAVALTVVPPTQIVEQPVGTTVPMGSTAIFAVQATGMELGYQWQQDGGTGDFVDILGATGSSLAVQCDSMHKDGWYFRVVVSGQNGSVTSGAVALYVIDPASILEVLVQPQPVTEAEGSKATFSVTAKGLALQYQWQVNKAGEETFADIPSAIDASYTTPKLIPGMDGWKYRVVVSSGLGEEVVYEISEAANLKVLEKTRIVVQPAPQTVEVGKSATFSVRATGTNITYQWQKSADGVVYTDLAQAQAAEYVLAVTTQEMDGFFYRVLVRGAVDSMTSTQVTLCVVQPPDASSAPVDGIQPKPPQERIQAENVLLDQNSAVLPVGEQIALIATVLPQNTTQRWVSWRSDNTQVATVNGGIVTARGGGSVVITATSADGNKTASCAVTVVQRVKSIVLETATLTLAKNASRVLKSTLLPANASNKAVKWTSSKPGTVSVSVRGVVKGLRTGRAVITVKAVDGSGKSASCVVTVGQPVRQITLSSAKATLYTGATLRLVANATPKEASNKGVRWVSSNEQIVEVSASGVVRGVMPGSATITAKAADGSGKTARCVVYVQAVVANIRLPQTALRLHKGASLRVPCIVETVNGTSVKPVWASSDCAVATVDKNGKIKAVGTGKALLVARAEGKTVRLSLTVVQAKEAVQTVQITGAPICMRVGETARLKATAKPAKATGALAAWSSSNTNLLRVDSAGTLYAKQVGTVYVTLTMGGKSQRVKIQLIL